MTRDQIEFLINKHGFDNIAVISAGSYANTIVTKEMIDNDWIEIDYPNELIHFIEKQDMILDGISSSVETIRSLRFSAIESIKFFKDSRPVINPIKQEWELGYGVRT